MKFSDDKEPLLTKTEAARLLNVTPRTLEIWARKKIILPVRFGRTVRYLRDDLLSHWTASAGCAGPALVSSNEDRTAGPLAELAKNVRRKSEAA